MVVIIEITLTSFLIMTFVVKGVPHFDEVFPSTNEERITFIAKILNLENLQSEFKLKQFSGGWTNTVYMFETPERRYTVREYGANTSLIIDRAAEFQHIQMLGFLKVYATFRNGVILTYQEGVPTDVVTLQDPKISDALATYLGKFHKVTLGQEGHVVEAWGRIDKFFAGIPQDSKTCDWFKLKEKVAAKRAFLEEKFKGRPLALCHNDLTPANILWDESTQSLGLIDYEYSLWNWPEYDIANHFFECVGLDFDISLFPQLDFQKRFIRTYLTALYDKEPTNELVDEWQQRVDLLVPMSGLLWGVWGHFEVASSQDQDWPYQLYADYRLILSELHLPLPEEHELRSHKLLPTV
jgi:thiamine kinase-like enzyme